MLLVLGLCAAAPAVAQAAAQDGPFSLVPTAPLEGVPFLVHWAPEDPDCAQVPLAPVLELAGSLATLRYQLQDLCAGSPPVTNVQSEVGPLAAGDYDLRLLGCHEAACTVLQEFPISVVAVVGDPPFGGTIFLDPNVITAEDPSSFTGLAFLGTGLRTMYDRRIGWVQLEAFLFEASFSDAAPVEVQVNPEFASIQAAEDAALAYLPAIGQLPRVLRASLETVWLHKGDEAFGGGNNNLLIHTGTVAQGYIADGILEETLVHEAAHTSLDALHAGADAWRIAQAQDRRFISDYARDHPMREDVAESVLPWLMVRLAGHVPDPAQAAAIEASIPARLAYFDAQDFDLTPLGPPKRVFANGFE